MRLLTRALVLLLAALPVTAVTVFALALQSRPLVTGVAQLTVDDIERAKRVFRSGQSRAEGDSGHRTVSIDEQDLTLALNYLVHEFGRGAARVAVRPGAATLQASVELPANPLGRYVNVDAAIHEAGAVPKFGHLTIGRVPVPGFIAEFLLSETLRRLTATDVGDVATRVVRSTRFEDGRLVATYLWSGELASLARSALITPEDGERLRAYQERLADAVANAPASLSLATLMPPLFRLAADRGGNDPVRENRAAIVVLALYVTGRPLDRFVSAAATWRKPGRRTVTLAARDDFPKHFLVSAAIAAEAGSPLADAIGAHKEVEDSRGGSGFSFNDIGANRAGMRFGEAATRSPRRARELAQAVAAGVSESDFMPEVSDLPEFLAEAEFRRRYGSVGSAGYEEMIATIDARIEALPLLRR